MTDAEYEELARSLADNPGEWLAWPEIFPNENAANLRMEHMRDGAVESFKVDSAAFQWRVDEFATIIDTRGFTHMEVSCAW